MENAHAGAVLATTRIVAGAATSHASCIGSCVSGSSAASDRPRRLRLF